MKRMLSSLFAAIFLVAATPALGQFSPDMSPEAVQQELANRLQTEPLVDVVRAMVAAGLSVDTILAGLVAFLGQPGYESVSLGLIAEAAIVAGLPAPVVVGVLINAVVARFGDIESAQLDEIISSAVAADVAVNGKAADVRAIARAAADTGKITFPEALAIASMAEVDALVQGVTAPVEQIEPVISTR